MRPNIILASGSEIRAKMLNDSGVDFTSEPARIDEDTIKQSLLAERANPRDVADTLAEIKALRVSARHPDAVVISCDQVLDFNGTLMNKPRSEAEALSMLTTMKGQKHSLHSAVVIARAGGPVWRFVGRTDLWMRDFSDDFLANYVARHTDSLLQTVGCYKLEADGVRLFSKIEGDYFTVLGLPLVQLLNQLSEIGALQK